ncbi:hypothetical protein OQ496_03325 [Acetobacter suratthaniensis]|uniref:Apea-like HEPN domain-containing protein n=1 Tax=Acetobacter suratthaniensis TaxID=1502841 RepID=A0ABS3LH43_9PROT|nr:hypothetical protein [Acetobacter suratthaniensis]MBO1326906.1 hypothetical protein [Acetobacter suratthaniensis]MCX2565487.1 hypothetical protein [Acetobacter suratthaniensis]
MSIKSRNLNKVFERALSPNVEMLSEAFSVSGFSGDVNKEILKVFIKNEKEVSISFTNTKKREIGDFDRGVQNLEKMRMAIKAINECIDFNRNSTEIYFRYYSEKNFDELEKEWKEKCDNLKKSLFDIPPPKKQNVIWHEIAVFYFCFYCAVTGADSFSRSGPAVRFISSILGGDVSLASIEGVLNKWKKRNSFLAHNDMPLWKFSIQIVAQSFEGLT